MMALILLLIGAIATVFSFFVIDDLQTTSDPYATPIGEHVFGGVDFEKIGQPVSLSTTLAAAPVLYRPNAVSNGGESITTENVPAETLVPETAAAPKDYFNDALFIGDSITEGIKNSGAIPAKQIIANKNVGLNSVANGDAVYYTTGTEPKSVLQAINELNPKPGKLYILLGANGMPGLDNESHIKFYYTLIDQLKKAYPDTLIYTVSVTPMTMNSDYIKKFTQKKIDEFNKLIQKMAEEKGVYYLDVQTALKGKDGYMVDDYAPTDGLHMNRKAHDIIFDYYKNHVVLPDKTMDKAVQAN